MIRKLRSGKYRLYSRKKNPKIGKRRLGDIIGCLAAIAPNPRLSGRQLPRAFIASRTST